MTRKNTIIKSTLILTLCMLVIKALGIIKQAVIAAYCGATVETDIFFLASGSVISLSTAIYSAISISALTFYSEKRIQKGPEEANRYINSILKFFLPFSLFLSLFVFIFSKQIGGLLAGSYSDNELNILSFYIKIMSITMFLNCYNYILNVVLETEKKFVPAKIYTFFQNTFIIIAAIFFYKRSGVVSLLIAFILASVAQCVFISLKVRKYYKFNIRAPFQGKEVYMLLSLNLPLFLGNAIYELNDLVDKMIASSLGDGKISVLTYGQSINEIVSTLIVGSLSTVLFANYVTWIAEGNTEKIKYNLEKTVNWIIGIMVPITGISIALSDEIVTILYGRGVFDENSIKLTSGVLISYSVGFIFMAIRSIFIKCFYAYKDSKIPMINGAIAVVCNIVLNIVLSRYIGVYGIGIATSVAMMIVAILSIVQIKKYIPDYTIKSAVETIYKTIIATVITTVFVNLLDTVLNVNVFVKLIVISLLASVVYIMMLWILKWNDLLNILNKRKKSAVEKVI